MTRPPFAEFSALAIRELNAWIGRQALWSQRFQDVLDEHVLPAAGGVGIDREDVFDELDDAFAGEVWGAALEDLCTRRYTDPPANLIEDFLKKRGYRLPPPARIYLDVLRESAPGIYEVVAVAPGRGLTLRDMLIEGPPFDVIEISGSREVVQWDRLAARVVLYGGNRVFTGVIVLLRNEEGEALLDNLRKLLHAHFERRNSAVTGESFRGEATGVLRDLAPLIAAMRISQILASTRRPLPDLVNRDGDPFEYVEASYAFAARRRKEILAKLDAEAALVRVGSRPPIWHWAGIAANDLPAATTPGERFSIDAHAEADAGQVVLASFKVAGTRFTISVNSRRRFVRAQALVEPLLAGLVGEPAIEIKSVEEAMAENSNAAEPARRRLPRKIERQITERLLSTHYRKWLDDKLPVLGGKTPREAARDFAGRESLVALLKDLENIEARRARETGVTYDASWLWRELGIEHLRR
jgi:hypothetical protein